MAKCWETRGCDEEMQSRCPHNIEGQLCPGDCNFSACFRPTHKFTSDFSLIFDPNIDHRACKKDVCQTCEFFLTNVPRINADANA